ncbi:S41 family peptidase [Pedobacter frigidisoli]|uniref:S41 family peptidase n=1 Tax=Pedobacter frigidisoli TaxID=2530455 RepID=UPI002930BBFB|nr:S41 family peptidase [Pedobacter frigidisoli]
MRASLTFSILILLTIATASTYAQSCNCKDNLEFVMARIKKNYVGYSDKVNLQTVKRFDFLTDSLLAEAGKVPTYQCLPILKTWLSFFNDKHISISYDDSGYSVEQIKDYYAREETTSWTALSFKDYLDRNKAVLDSVEGVWKDESGAYQIGIVKDRGDFIGFIIKADGKRWLPQQVKMRISKIGNVYGLKYFRAIDHSNNILSIYKNADTLTFTDGKVLSRWFKNGPPVSVSGKQQAGTSTEKPSFKILDDKTCLFQLPAYATLANVAAVDSILKQHKNAIKNHRHLIIDIRNNYGGSVLVYDKLIPYLYTRPILTEGGSVLATEENIRDYYSAIPANIPDSIKKGFVRNLNVLKAHLNQLYPLYPVDTIKLEEVMAYPKEVSIVVNRNTASAAELFMLQAKQSSKVKLFGERSSGAIDYLEVVKTKLPCDIYTLGYPACKSSRLPDFPLDNTGIQPDVRITSEIKDWVGFIQSYKER